MDFGRKMPFFPLDCGKMSAENMILCAEIKIVRLKAKNESQPIECENS